MKKQHLIVAIAFLIVGLSACSGVSEPKQEIKDEAKQETNNEFKVVGFHLDLRVQVMKLEALKEFANELAFFGVNTLVMEWEATFQFEKHPLIANKDAYTREEIKEFIAHCETIGIDVIPLQQSLGHVEYILRHARYADIRESHKDVSQLCPLEAELNKALFTDLFTELAEVHPSKYIHIGGDEAYLFGDCKNCSKKVEEEGKATLLADHLKMICEIVVSLGKTPVLWADVANKYPEKLTLLPKETVFIVWNYGWALDRFGDPAKLTKQGFEVWGAPSLRSNPDNFYLTRWEYHFNNTRDFIPQCRNSNYAGIIMTSWSTSGVYSTVFEDKQTITELIAVRHVYPISGFRILMAAYSQAMKQNDGLNIEEFIISYCSDRYGFNKNEALQFWEALKGEPYEIIDGKVEKNEDLTVKAALDSEINNQKIFNTLKPAKNADEYEHFKLMKDIRVNYLTFKQIEVFVNSPEFGTKDLPAVLSQLENLIKKDEPISERFTAMNQHLLKESQIDYENNLRIARVKLLYERLKK